MAVLVLCHFPLSESLTQIGTGLASPRATFATPLELQQRAVLANWVPSASPVFLQHSCVLALPHAEPHARHAWLSAAAAVPDLISAPVLLPDTASAAFSGLKLQLVLWWPGLQLKMSSS